MSSPDKELQNDCAGEIVSALNWAQISYVFK